MTNFNQLSQLEIEEIAAEQMQLPASEEEVSELFDEDVVPTMREGIPKTDFRIIFNDWIENQHRMGELSDAQRNQYCYCGEYEDWLHGNDE